jgi:hypothetical protein
VANRRDQHDVAMALLAQYGNGRLACMHDVDRRVLDRPHRPKTGIVHENVEHAEACAGRADAPNLSTLPSARSTQLRPNAPGRRLPAQTAECGGGQPGCWPSSLAGC